MNLASRFACVWLVASGCVPDFEDQTSLVVAPRVLAIRSTPAEVAERQSTSVEALVASPDGASVDLRWTLCLARKPLTELGPVSPECLASPEPPSEEIATALGSGERARLSVPAEACTLFGPERPDPKPGEASARAVDADQTGGYYQPVVAWLDGEPALGAVRLTCALGGVTRETSVEFTRRYRPNQNPGIERLERSLDDGTTAALDETTFAPGQRVELQLTAASCPTEDECGDAVCGPTEDAATCAEDCREPKGCAGAERYVVYDRAARSIVERAERLVVSWYASAGKFAESQTELEDGREARIQWTAPRTEGSVRFWAVLRDDRGGADWVTATAEVSRGE